MVGAFVGRVVVGPTVELVVGDSVEGPKDWPAVGALVLSVAVTRHGHNHTTPSSRTAARASAQYECETLNRNVRLTE